MSLQTNRISLLFLFLLTLVSCEEPSDIGLNLSGQNLLGTSYDKSRAISASTITQPDSIFAFKSNPILVGQATDGELGEVAAAQYTEIGLNSTALALSGKADSMVLVMAYNGYYYGDTTANLTVNVHRLSENFKDDQTYYTTTTIPAPDRLGHLEFKPKYHRTSRSPQSGKVQPASFSRVVRIPLNDPAGIALANDLVSGNRVSDLASQESFRQYWKGVVISATGKSVVGFNTFPDSAGTPLGRVAGINLYFKDQNNVPMFHNFSFSGTYYYNGITATRTGALNLKRGEEVLSTQTGNVTYIQENTGVKTRLTFPNLAELKTQQGNIYVNHAELILPVKNGTINANGKISKAPDAIFLYESTPGKRVSKTTGGVSNTVQSGNSSAFGITSPNRAVYVADSGFYKANVTSYIQALLEDRKPNNGIIVSPQAEDSFTQRAALGSAAGFPGTVSVNRAQLEPAKMQLRIYYTKIN